MRWWVLGELESEHALLSAVSGLKARDFTRLDAYTPFPVEGLTEALGLAPSRVAWLALPAGLGGAGMGYLIQWFCNAIDWPLNVGNRPAHSALSFVPITFETGVLIASGTIFLSCLALFGFPRLSHPVFRVAAFERASIDRFWVSVVTEREGEQTRAVEALRELGASAVSVVEEEAP